MKLITLNTWAGRLKEPFDAFLKAKMSDTDIFCFQEIFNEYPDEKTGDYVQEDGDGGRGNILREITEILTEYQVYFCPVATNVYGIAIFLKKGIEVVTSGEVMLYENPNYDPLDDAHDHNRKMQWIHIKNGRKDFMVMNVHGHYDAIGKGDTPNRLAQSKIITEFIETTGLTPKILVGDFNLNPTTESIKLLEKHVNNLVTKNNIASTHTEHYTGEEKHADYIFVSPEVLVEDFKVLPDVVSDHAPLYIQFDVF